MISETAEVKKGTWEGKGEMRPRPRHREEAEPGATPTCPGQGQEYVHQVLQSVDQAREQAGEDRAPRGSGGHGTAGSRRQADRFGPPAGVHSCPLLLRLLFPEDAFLLPLTPKVFLEESLSCGSSRAARPS